jgi:Zn-dependent protease with chaperone function
MSTSPSEAPGVDADYYDGASARAHRVRVSLAAGRLRVLGDGIEREAPLARLRVSEPLGSAPRLITFADGAHCQVRDLAGLAALLARAGHRESWVARLDTRWHWALAAVLLSVAALAGAYVWGLPAFSKWLAFKIPEAVVGKLGEGSLAVLDRGMLAPSRLPAERQAALRARFAALAAPEAAKPAHRLEFRAGALIGANALALPNGTLVVTDELIALADDDAQILAVLGHELGHVRHRHGLRMLIQSSIVGLLVAWYLGDVSNIAAGLPTLLLEAGYSRDHEREADDYGAAMLRANGLATAHLATMLAKLEQAHRPGAPQGGASAMDYLASHPATRERIARLRGGTAR